MIRYLVSAQKYIQKLNIKIGKNYENSIVCCLTQ